MLVLGETGCGKEVVVNLIQQLSKRESGPFVKLNCGAIPETLIDDEFFGHEKGAFTDAKIQKKGVFERACGGTLFLDEIGELSLAAQVRLLRVLQQKVVTRIGGVQSIPVDFRLESCWIRFTTTSLPQPVSPKTSIGTSVELTFSTFAVISFSEGVRAVKRLTKAIRLSLTQSFRPSFS